MDEMKALKCKTLGSELVHVYTLHSYVYIIILILQLSVHASVQKGHRKLFDPSRKPRFLCISELGRYRSSRSKQLATGGSKY